MDAALQREGSWLRAEEAQARLGERHQYYGASVGAVRGTVRDMLRRHRDLVHDDITALSSELWSVPVFERRLAAVVLLQSRVALLNNSDLTRIEGFIREARLGELVDPASCRRRPSLNRRARRAGERTGGRCAGALGEGS